MAFQLVGVSRCGACGWSGSTLGEKLHPLNVVLYLATASAVVSSRLFDEDANSTLKVVLVVALIFWFNASPRLLARLTRCAECKGAVEAA